jgi:hypothetical protein
LIDDEIEKWQNSNIGAGSTSDWRPDGASALAMSKSVPRPGW